MTPDFDAAAIKAAETLIKHHVSFAPIIPLPILKSIPGVMVLSFAEIADTAGLDRQNVVSAFCPGNRDVVTTTRSVNGKQYYLVAYNQRLPFYMLQRALARELGHIVLQHDGSRPEAVRSAEALCFARHFLCPRPLMQMLMESQIPLTVETLGNVTGCYERCLKGIQKTPGVHVPAEMNRRLREQFTDYVKNFIDCQPIMPDGDDSSVVSFGTYMDYYEE